MSINPEPSTLAASLPRDEPAPDEVMLDGGAPEDPAPAIPHTPPTESHQAHAQLDAEQGTADFPRTQLPAGLHDQVQLQLQLQAASLAESAPWAAGASGISDDESALPHDESAPWHDDSALRGDDSAPPHDAAAPDEPALHLTPPTTAPTEDLVTARQVQFTSDAPTLVPTVGPPSSEAAAEAPPAAVQPAHQEVQPGVPPAHSAPDLSQMQQQGALQEVHMDASLPPRPAEADASAQLPIAPGGSPLQQGLLCAVSVASGSVDHAGAVVVLHLSLATGPKSSLRFGLGVSVICIKLWPVRTLNTAPKRMNCFSCTVVSKCILETCTFPALECSLQDFSL